MSNELYETIGGGDTVSAAIKSFYNRVLQDDSLRPFFDSSDVGKLRARQSMFVSMLLGGNVVYTGRDIGLAHSTVRIQGLSDEHFDSFLKHFRDALDEVGVMPENAAKVMRLLEAKRSTILHR